MLSSKKLIILSIIVSMTMSAPVPNNNNNNKPLLLEPVNIEEEWLNWKELFEKNYETPEEEEKRHQIFTDNAHKIAVHNGKFQAGEVTWSQGLNQFADLTIAEIRNCHFGLIHRKSPELSIST